MPHDADLYATGVKGATPAATRAAFESTIDAAQAEYQSSFDGTNDAFQGRLDLEEAPSITTIDPTAYEAQAEDTELTVTVTGNGFTGVTAAHLGAVAATSVTITDDHELEAVFPIPVAEADLNVVVSKGAIASNAVELAFTIAP